MYNYCNSTDTVKSGVTWTKKQLKNVELDMPIFIDIEDSSIKNLGKTKLTNIAKTFCENLKSEFDVGVYANLDWFKNYLNIEDLQKYKIWLAQWSDKHTADFTVNLWQYSSKGKVNGISGNVDLNKCLVCEPIEDNKNQMTGQTVEYEKGKVYETLVDLKVRKGAGTNYSQKKYSELTEDGKKNAYKQELAVLKKGTKVTCKSVTKKKNGDIWLKIPSGYIAGYYQGKVYVN